MKEEKSNKTKIIHIRLDKNEHDALIRKQKGTTERNLSSYCRKVLQGKPLIKSVQNESLLEILHTLSLLQKDLNGIGNNYNQMVKRLHTTSQIPEVKKWFAGFLSEKGKMLEGIQSVKLYLDKTAQKWLQE